MNTKITFLRLFGNSLLRYLLLLRTTMAFSQPGKDGRWTISVSNTVLNRYTRICMHFNLDRYL